jgi:hypothetical protein
MVLSVSNLPYSLCYTFRSLSLLGLIQSPWVQPEQGHHRREFRYQVTNRGKRFDVADHQLIDVLNDHLCYVITDRRTPWSLPSPYKFSLMTKIVITHAAKSRCRLSIYTRVDWRKDPLFGKGNIILASQSRSKTNFSTRIDRDTSAR